MTGQHYAPAAVHPGKKSATHRTGGWEGLSAHLDVWRRENFLTPTGDSIVCVKVAWFTVQVFVVTVPKIYL